MAIIKKTESTPTQLELSVNNGDLQALNEVITKYGFVDEEAALRFALYVLLKAEQNAVYVKEGSRIVSVTPTKVNPIPHDTATNAPTPN
jgi:hypothetical protein